MPVFRDYELRISYYRTIYKLVIIRISRYQIKVEIGRNKYGVRVVHYDIDCQHCKLMTNFTIQYFLIFFQYLICNAKFIVPVKQ